MDGQRLQDVGSVGQTESYRRVFLFELDVVGFPVLLQIQQLLLEFGFRHRLPVHGRLHVVREQVVEVGAERVNWTGTEMNIRGRRGERDVGGGHEPGEFRDKPVYGDFSHLCGFLGEVCVGGVGGNLKTQCSLNTC